MINIQFSNNEHLNPLLTPLCHFEWTWLRFLTRATLRYQRERHPAVRVYRSSTNAPNLPRVTRVAHGTLEDEVRDIVSTQGMITRVLGYDSGLFLLQQNRFWFLVELRPQLEKLNSTRKSPLSRGCNSANREKSWNNRLEKIPKIAKSPWLVKTL